MNIIITFLSHLILFSFVITAYSSGIGSECPEGFPTPEEIGKMNVDEFITKFTPCQRNAFGKLWDNEHKRRQAEKLALILKKEKEEEEKEEKEKKSHAAHLQANESMYVELTRRVIRSFITSQIQQTFNSTLFNAVAQVLCELVLDRYFHSDVEKNAKRKKKEKRKQERLERKKDKYITNLTKSD